MDALKNGWSAGSPSQSDRSPKNLSSDQPCCFNGQCGIQACPPISSYDLLPSLLYSSLLYIGTRMTRDSARRASSSAREKNGGNSGDSPSSTSEVGHLTHVTFNWKTGIILRKKLKIGSTVSFCSTGLLYNKTGKVSTSQT